MKTTIKDFDIFRNFHDKKQAYFDVLYNNLKNLVGK